MHGLWRSATEKSGCAAEVIPPNVVAWMCEQFDINIEPRVNLRQIK